MIFQGMIDVEEVKRKIISYLETDGPSLPVRIAKKIELSPVFTSAILSELVQDQKVKMSNLRVGSSPLYLIQGNEKDLENFTDNLGGVEKTAYLKLKQSKVLQDEKQEPSIRVALRSIKDFAVAIKFQDKIFWKYAFTTNEEITKALENKTDSSRNNLQNTTQTPKNNTLNIINDNSRQIKREKPSEDGQPNEADKNKFFKDECTKPAEKPLLEIKPKKKKKIPQEFLNEVREYLETKDIELVETFEIKKKELTGKIRINSDLGKISFLLIAKDKKRPSLTDLTKAEKEARHEKMTCYFLARGNPASTTKDFLEEHKNIFKTDVF